LIFTPLIYFLDYENVQSTIESTANAGHDDGIREGIYENGDGSRYE
jgi:hypothetical protein